jgi:hypothetical protein
MTEREIPTEHGQTYDLVLIHRLDGRELAVLGHGIGGREMRTALRAADREDYGADTVTYLRPTGYPTIDPDQLMQIGLLAEACATFAGQPRKAQCIAGLHQVATQLRNLYVAMGGSDPWQAEEAGRES